MLVRVLFLGPLADLAGTDAISVPAPLDWAGLLEAVAPAVAELLPGERVKVACSGRVLTDKKSLRAVGGDEVALLPPVSGG
ncbi:MoaD/ThiS family protein [Allopontixanthobacter sp.]|uniref:MoaD/ThiS family protein n=1 Tax=Allopontixanthobacter sp. TaxID=2906452 RepID=UPI002ABA2981|nr:MoaD/ThiS family protein [Allopontixanthobacter sp.]MDZ4308430.1 MoaD/ThiS family protein [Allopontixanthobacter sp.]